MDRLALMQAFVRIVETGSISAVAREMGTAQPTVSKQLAALESALGVTLLQRTTRRLRVTEAGEAYYRSARKILDDVAALEGSIGQLSAGLTGTLTVTMATVMGEMGLDELLLEFHARHPGLHLNLMETARYVDLVQEGIDVAIRVGRLQDSTLVARRLGYSRRIVVASPEYIARHGAPKVPEDLLNHECIRYLYLATGNEWVFQRQKQEVHIRVQGTFASNSGLAIRRAALLGRGIASSPVWMVGKDVEEGRLVHVLAEFAPPAVEINAVYPYSRHVPEKVTALADFLRARFAELPQFN